MFKPVHGTPPDGGGPDGFVVVVTGGAVVEDDGVDVGLDVVDPGTVVDGANVVPEPGRVVDADPDEDVVTGGRDVSHSTEVMNI